MRHLPLISKVSNRIPLNKTIVIKTVALVIAFVASTLVSVRFPGVSLASPGGTDTAASNQSTDMAHRLSCSDDELIEIVHRDYIVDITKPLPLQPQDALGKYLENLYPSRIFTTLNVNSFTQTYLDSDSAEFTKYENGKPVMIVALDGFGIHGWKASDSATCSHLLAEGKGLIL